MTDSQIITLLIKSLINRGYIKNQANLAEKIGCDPALITLIKNGKRNLTGETKDLITDKFKNVNKEFLDGNVDKVFTDISSEAGEGKNLKDELLIAKDQIIELLKENSRLNAQLQDCWMQLGIKKEGKQPNFS